MSDRDTTISEFVAITNAPASVASKLLQENDWDLESAVSEYYLQQTAQPTAGSSSAAAAAASSHHHQGPANYGSKRSNFGSFADLRSDDEADDKTDTNFFTGGEKSALQVEDPNKKDPLGIVGDLLRKAQESANEPDTRPSATQQANPRQFKGTGYKLGSEDVPSQTIPDPHAHLRQPLEKVTRTITFWKEGFQVGDGKLYRYDDPANAAYLNELNSGRAPLALLDVQFGQDVDVNVMKRLDEDYKPPKRKLGGFVGSGHRLGSPVPGEPVVEEEVHEVEKPETEETKPEAVKVSTSVQVRLANGTRIAQGFDANDPVSRIFDLVRQNTSESRPYILSLAYPLKPIEESSATIEEAGLKNSVIVQRWK
ncbi:unnamed protein product [Kuraishia capsulata CBS 1993]|uniref:UBX domain-containing protein n=1 Tax=Kuraishia capsulata CBS 1993 TaxID=1382522 RepID=W6MH34_9ASCO|nr:uncharacterized protein KUCA_T00001474001 [Kuraishia capsulata CBS 1993]CDK25504.1 unnamed protein product [Kuraishia capsulata CBS 1993]